MGSRSCQVQLFSREAQDQRDERIFSLVHGEPLMDLRKDRLFFGQLKREVDQLVLTRRNRKRDLRFEVRRPMWLDLSIAGERDRCDTKLFAVNFPGLGGLRPLDVTEQDGAEVDIHARGQDRYFFPFSTTMYRSKSTCWMSVPR